MKVAVYSIALNEEQFVERWADTAKDADYLLIADTGSTDKTVELAKACGINVYSISVKPWRFDDARNASLSLIPSDIDYCIALDLDETLVPGWREHLEVAHKNGWTRPRYLFTTSWNPDGSPGMQFSGFRIHARNGYRWKYSIHEIPEPYRLEETSGWVDLQIEHHPDDNKSRGQYLPLLKEAAAESPEDDRCSFYYARELYFYGMYEEAAEEFRRHLSLSKSWWKPQRAASYRYLGECEPQNSHYWWRLGYEEDPTRRECAFKLTEYYYNLEDWEECREWAEKTIAIAEKSLDYFCEPWAWSFSAHDYLALSYYNLGEYEKALEQGKIALSLDPSNERLAVNISHYTEKLQEN